MDRREFIRLAVLSTIGVGLNTFAELLRPSKVKAFSILETAEPMIYKRFLDFTEYEERPETNCIVIHHTGFPDVDKDSKIIDIHKLHQEVNGWAGVGYHYLIRKNGMIEQGRLPEAIGAHAYQHNKTSIGVCLTGNFDIGKPTKEQMASVKELTAWLCRKYDIDSYKKGAIVGHRNLNDTSCPGEALYRKLDEIRDFCQYN